MSLVTLSGAASTARVERGLGPKGDGGESAAGFVPPGLQEMQGIGRQVSAVPGATPSLVARQSDAFGSAGRRAPEGAAEAAPSGGLGAPARGRYWGYFRYKKREFSIQDIIIYHHIS